MTNKFWKTKENHVLEILKKKGYVVELIENFDENGNELPQVYYVGKYPKSRPDIDVYDAKTSQVAIFRVEVKGHRLIPEIGGKKFLPIKARHFENYMEFEFLSEVETKIIFVIGNDDGFGYEYFWENLQNMNRMTRTELSWKGKLDTKKFKYYFFNPSDFKYGLEGFC